jgi:hypothetical protein
VQSNEDGAHNQDSIAMSLRFVIADQEGQHLRFRAAEMQTIFANQDLHDNYTEEFVEFIFNHKKRQDLSFHGKASWGEHLYNGDSS